jgi:hypothetical protein
MTDLDERIERVMAMVLNPKERADTKEAIRNGYLKAEWDEETNSPRFTPTPKMLEHIRRRNNDGMAQN